MNSNNDIIIGGNLFVIQKKENYFLNLSVSEKNYRLRTLNYVCINTRYYVSRIHTHHTAINIALSTVFDDDALAIGCLICHHFHGV